MDSGSSIWTPGGERPVGPTPEAGGAPVDEARLLDELGRLGVVDVLVSAAATVAQIAYVRLDARHRDLDEARRAIEAPSGPHRGRRRRRVRTTSPRDVRQTIANLQLHYAQAVEAQATSRISPPRRARRISADNRLVPLRDLHMCTRTRG